MVYLYGLIIFLLGLAVGSFLNVYTRRTLKERSVRGRSLCESCGRILSALDLIPLFSFLHLKGKCRYCRKPMSLQYPLVELGTALIFVLVFLERVHPFLPSSPLLFSLNFLFWLAIAAFLISFAVTDFLESVLVEKALLGAIALAVLYQLLVRIIPLSKLYLTLRGDETGLGGYILQTDFLKNRVLSEFVGLSPVNINSFLFVLLSAVSVLLFFAVLRFITSGRGLGEGDLFLGFLAGLITGFPGVLIALFFSFVLGALLSVALLMSRRRKFGETVPFGPFLAAGILIAALYGDSILAWYMSTFRL